MRPITRFKRSGFRQAILASVAIHVALLAILLAWTTLAHSQAKLGQTSLDTSIHEITLRLDPENSVILATPEHSQKEQSASPSPQVSPEVAHPPTVSHVPITLPHEILDIIRHVQNAGSPIGPRSPQADPNVKPANAGVGSDSLPLHGAMKPQQSVVYILDCSGSMGEFGKLTLARSALVATLNRQPEGVRFQVIPYNGTARSLFPGGLITVTANLNAAEIRLASLEPSGRSNHTEALRVALDLRPDYIVWLTDADDLSVSKLKSVLNSAAKPIPVYIATVTARGVGQPHELQ